eukprot:scpid106066/ scgid17766/ 
MKNLTMILLGVAMVACFSLGLAHAKPSVLSDITENEANWAVAAQSTDKSVAVQELAAAVAKNLVDLAAVVNYDRECRFRSHLFEQICGTVPKSFHAYARLTAECKGHYATLREHFCPSLPRL